MDIKKSALTHISDTSVAHWLHIGVTHRSHIWAAGMAAGHRARPPHRGIARGLSRYLAELRYLAVSRGISRYLAVFRGISRYLAVSRG